MMPENMGKKTTVFKKVEELMVKAIQAY